MAAVPRCLYVLSARTSLLDELNRAVLSCTGRLFDPRTLQEQKRSAPRAAADTCLDDSLPKQFPFDCTLAAHSRLPETSNILNNHRVHSSQDNDKSIKLEVLYMYTVQHFKATKSLRVLSSCIHLICHAISA